MTFILILLLAVGCGYLADRSARENLTLRWIRSGRKYDIQYRSVLGLWLPYGGQRFVSEEKAHAWIDQELVSLAHERLDKTSQPLSIREATKHLLETTPSLATKDSRESADDTQESEVTTES